MMLLLSNYVEDSLLQFLFYDDCNYMWLFVVNCVYIFAAYVIYGDFNMFRALSQQPYYLHATELPRGINVMGDFVTVRKNGDKKI